MPDPIPRLAPLVGRWEATAAHPADPTATMRAEVTFEWHEGAFLLQRSVTDHPDFPDGVMIIGGDDATERFSVCYSDDRGVRRVYEMTVADGVWRQWRDVAGFAQRFTGTFSEDGDTVTGAWEMCQDGETWTHDFDITYRKVD